MSEDTMESVEAFRARARTWLAENLRRNDELDPVSVGEDDTHEWVRSRELQRKLYAGGFAGICFPREYGGLGLPIEYQRAFDQESAEYELPLLLNVPTFAICAATLLDVGSEEQKRDRIGAAIRGEEVLCQLLSEPSGGSDLAGVITRAERTDDGWLLNGAKVWSTSAYAADWGLCLARTDWDVPKHQGLTMFLVPVRAPGVTLNRIRMVNGADEFCEEFFDDVLLPADAVVGEVGDGWSVASRQMFHERNSMGGGSPYTSGRGTVRTMPGIGPAEMAAAVNRSDDPEVRAQLGELLAMARVHEQTVDRVSASIASGVLPPAASSLLRLMGAEVIHFKTDATLRTAGSYMGFGEGTEEGPGGLAAVSYLMRQSNSLGGGTTEIARNIISERVLGMPREPAMDRDVPFRQVRRGR